MSKEEPLWLRLYREPELFETARAIGYNGCAAGELEARLAPLVERFGRGRVERALFHLTNFSSAQPPATVKLRENVAALCWQLLGPPPGHQEFNRFRSGEPWKPPWTQPPEPSKVEEQPKPRKGKNRRENRDQVG